MNLVFFGAACSVMVGSAIAAVTLVFELNPCDALMMLFLLIFGGIMAVLYTPFFKQIKAIGFLKMYIGKYLNILMRVTGTGAWFVFLGCTLFTGIYNSEDGVLMRVVAFLLCIPTVFVGFVAIVVGVVKSLKLKKAQDELRKMDEQNALEQRLDQWAQTYRGERCAFTPLEFNKLCEDTKSIRWEDADLKLIFDALVSNPKWRVNSASTQQSGRHVDEAKIPKEDLLSWVRGSVVML